MKKTVLMAALVLALFVFSSHMKLVESGPEDCLDACYTGCVSNDSRALSRCEGKCRIRCGPGLKAAEIGG